MWQEKAEILSGRCVSRDVLSPETAAVVNGSLVQMVAWIGGDVLGRSPR